MYTVLSTSLSLLAEYTDIFMDDKYFDSHQLTPSSNCQDGAPQVYTLQKDCSKSLKREHVQMVNCQVAQTSGYLGQSDTNKSKCAH